MEISLEEKEATRNLKHYISITPHWKLKEYTFSEIDHYIKITLNYIERLQKENEELEKTIDLIIDDFQMENYFVGMTNKEVREYYEKRLEINYRQNVDN